VERTLVGQATTDGAGVHLTRVITQDLQRRLDPFLMLDAFGSDDPNDYLAGFPDHPHRGFETVTYMIAGRMLHRDSAGHEGLIETGGVQWMTAGRGLVHSEIPQQTEGRMEGFQLWINLPASEKMIPPWYRNFTANELPRFVTPEGVAVTVIAGVSHGIGGAVTRPATTPLFLDLHLPAGTLFEQGLPAEHNAVLYVYRGRIEIGDQTLSSQRLAILDNAPESDGLAVRAIEDSRALLIAGRPLREPIVQQGPFVMNTVAEIQQAVRDYSAGRLH
jgi:redox-sensitive bicupin YhaK (pirin superfamily)